MADRDQAASDSDQRVSDRDQVLSDRELGANPPADSAGLRAHELAKAGRGEGTMTRMATTAVRAQVAAERHEQAWRRDEMARHRDEVAAARDRESEEVDMAAEEMAGQLGKDSPAVKVAAVARASAAGARTRAAEDRRRAGRDREEAARDRQEAASDRALLMAEIERSQMDTPTGAYGRRLGEVLLRHELEHAQGMSRTLALGVVTFEKTAKAEQHQDDSALTVLARDLFLALWGGFVPLIRSFAGARKSSSALSPRSTPRRHGAGFPMRALKLPSATPKTQPASGWLLLWMETTTPSRAWSSGPASRPRPSAIPFRRQSAG